MIPKAEWEWFGDPAHFICARDCQFHLATLVGPWLISTVGKFWPDMQVLEITAEVRGVTLTGRGDARRVDAFRKLGGWQEVGCDRKFETMVFRAGARCTAPGCECGMPALESVSELDFGSYNDSGSATQGHMALCEKWAGIGVDDPRAEQQ